MYLFVQSVYGMCYHLYFVQCPQLGQPWLALVPDFSFSLLFFSSRHITARHQIGLFNESGECLRRRAGRALQCAPNVEPTDGSVLDRRG